MTYLFGVLSVLSLISMMVKHPWTIIIARRSTPPEVWSTGLFLETNMIITGAWAVLFCVAAVISITMPFWVNILIGVIYVLLGKFSSRISLWYSSKRLKSMTRDQHYV
ncbi:MAG TPA: hypothetical protein PLV78_15500 [Deltaproteobacteria bacterium]|nr:hypothetical protein [Deltaproteobacteria bacterium]